MQGKVQSGYSKRAYSFIDWRLLAFVIIVIASRRKKYSFHKLIRVIRIFMRKIFVVHCHPRNIFNIELFLNYGILLQIFISIISYILNNGFHTTTLN